jgi:gamma-glutamylcyclotransferase (GGCT)/AIG2-like uncharacterized protein YtfP
MLAEPQLLFVYGTLRPGLAEAAGHLVDDLERAGTATVRGLLFDLGEYPGMVAGDGIVHGELLRVDDAARLAALDEYEGCGGPGPLFERHRTTVRLDTGEELTAWAYFYVRSVAGKERVPGGDYAAHRQREF